MINVIFIKNIRAVDPVSGTDSVMDILIKNGKIAQTGNNLTCPENAIVICGTGLVAAPGLIDTHVHFRDPGQTYKEDIITGAAAAAHGGFTTVICMANTVPTVDNTDTLNYVIEKGKTTGIRVLQASAVTKGLKGQELTDMKKMAKAGAAGFTDDGVPIMDTSMLAEAMKRAKELNLPISLHEEDPSFIDAPGVNKGRVSKQLNYGGASPAAEEVMVARDCMIALNTGAAVCIQHISSGNSVELVRLAKKLGADIHAEASPHHFTLTEDAVLEHGTLARMNPPLREEKDRQQIIEGLKDGTIDLIATDHAPHSTEEKSRPMEKAPSGITGLETALGLGIKSLVQSGHITLLKLMELMSKNPAELYRLEPVSLKKGSTADIVIFGENEEWTVEKFFSKSENSPFKGMTLPGKVHFTICGGKIVFDSSRL